MKDTVTFLVNGRTHELRSPEPNLTLLQYLRQEGLRGTKEGCAEGDCGACTAVVARLDEKQELKLEAVNTCILFVPSLDGQAVVTVEGVASQSSGLHPAQAAMVDCHGSQCGFCTPGFVMSLFACHQNMESHEARDIEEALVGNLCRCTGYAPILEAARKMFDLEGEGSWDRHALVRLRESLLNLQSEEELGYTASSRQFYAPKSLESLAKLREKFPEAHLLAGGTDLGLLVTKQHRRLEVMISTQKVMALREIQEEKDGLLVGSAASYTRLMPYLKKHFSSFYDLVFRLGSKQIRNQGTMGGNLVNASPIGDSAPALLALGAKVNLRKGESSRSLPLSEFFTGYRQTALLPGEFLESIFIPYLKEDENFACYKLSKRADQDISSVCGVFWVQMQGGICQEARIGFGGMAATPVRAKKTEEFLRGKSLDTRTAEIAMQMLHEEFEPMSDFRGTAAYRRRAGANLLLKFVLEVTEPELKMGVIA